MILAQHASDIFLMLRTSFTYVCYFSKHQIFGIQNVQNFGSSYSGSRIFLGLFDENLKSTCMYLIGCSLTYNCTQKIAENLPEIIAESEYYRQFLYYPLCTYSRIQDDSNKGRGSKRVETQNSLN